MNFNIYNNLQEITLTDIKKINKTESHVFLLKSNNTASKKDFILTMIILIILMINVNTLLILIITFSINQMKIR